MDPNYTDKFEYISEDGEYSFQTKEELEEILRSDFPDEFTSLETDEDLEVWGFEKIGVKTIPRYENCFLTERAIKTHIKQNHYHYNNPTDYLSHAFRNPELEKLINAVFEIEELNENERIDD